MPKPPKKAPKAPEPHPEPKKVTTGILFTANGIAEDSVAGVNRFHKINVRQTTGFSRPTLTLYNHEAVCGPRLVKGEGFPFDPCSIWWIYTDQFAAEDAAQLLQDYLDEFENPKLKAERKKQ